jgi:four helix bundle protein
MPFLALDLSIDLVRCLRAPLALIRQRNGGLANQLDRACDSVALNLGEAGGRFGGDRLQHFRIAYGSLREVRTGLQLAVAKGFLDGNEPVHAVADRLGGMLYRLATS